MSKLETIITQASELTTADLGELIPRITDLLKRKIDKKSQLKLKLNLARKDWHPITKI
jgi:predicted XRE-type DNA-binding protein